MVLRISDLDILKSATLTPAITHYIDDRKGSLEPGKDADVIIFDRIADGDHYRFGDVKYVLVKGNGVHIIEDFLKNIVRRSDNYNAI